MSPSISSNLPEFNANSIIEFLFGLASSGVYLAVVITNNAVRSYRTFSPLPFFNGGIFSAALSGSSRCPDVIWRCVL